MQAGDHREGCRAEPVPRGPEDGRRVLPAQRGLDGSHGSHLRPTMFAVGETSGKERRIGDGAGERMLAELQDFA